MSEAFDAYIGDRYFHITFKGIKNLGIGQVYFSDLTDRKKYENKLKESERKLRELSFYLQDSLEEEKQRIGMELHDSIGQNLMLLKMKLNNSLEKDNFINSYNDISETVNVTINEIRSIIFNLKPRVLEDIGLSAAIDQLVEHLNKLTSIEGSFNVEGVPVRLSSKHELFLFRILQEAINNILKHSRATEYHIQMYYLPEVLKIVVTDDGIGINTDAIESGRYKGNGLFNIKERINSINGRMFIESTEQEGSMILLEVPIWKE